MSNLICLGVVRKEMGMPIDRFPVEAGAILMFEDATGTATARFER